MKIYQVEHGQSGFILKIQNEVEGVKYWQYVGSFAEERASIYILLAVTGDISMSFEYAEVFGDVFLNKNLRYPRIISARDVLGFVSDRRPKK